MLAAQRRGSAELEQQVAYLNSSLEDSRRARNLGMAADVSTLGEVNAQVFCDQSA